MRSESEGRRNTEMKTEADVLAFREEQCIPKSVTCPRWIDCPCRHISTKTKNRCGAIQLVFGQGVYCQNCGALL